LLGEPSPAEEIGLVAKLAGLEVEVDEDRHLGLEHPGVERLSQVVHRPRGVAEERLLRLGDRGGQEDDRHVAGPGVMLDPGGGLQAAHPRHHDVQQDDRELLVTQRLERLLAGLGRNHDLVQRRQDGVQGDQVLDPVVDK